VAVGSTNAINPWYALAYISNRASSSAWMTCRTVGWRNEFTTGPGGGVLCGISVYFGPEIGWVTKFDGAENTDFESVKGGLSDSMKRAGYSGASAATCTSCPTLGGCEARARRSS